MRKVGGFIFSFFLVSHCSFAAVNSCVQCHEKQATIKYLQHNFADWQQSIHAAKGIGCNACHGGNPLTSDPVKAHQGVLPSRDEKSSVYFKNVAETCGRCHKAEFAEFQKSAHYKTLQRTGKGPNCLTCHGAMATTVMKYSEMDRTCSLCHGKPTQAAKALSLIDASKRSLDLYQKKLAQKYGTKIPKEELEKEKQFLDRYKTIQQMWHSFNVTEVTEMSEALIKDLTHKP